MKIAPPPSPALTPTFTPVPEVLPSPSPIPTPAIQTPAPPFLGFEGIFAIAGLLTIYLLVRRRKFSK
jgi:hypothetical protein